MDGAIHLEGISLAKPIDQNIQLAIGLKLTSVLLFVATAIKSMQDIPLGEMVFFRSAFAMLPIFAFLALRGELRAGLATKRPFAHLIRGLFGISGMVLGFTALMRLPLPEATTLNYTAPLMVVVLGALILKERVGIYRWTAVAVGITGILIIAWPRLTLFTSGTPLGREEMIGVIAALSGATIAAVAQIYVRRLIVTETSAAVVMYFSVTASVLALCTLPFGWVMPTPFELSLMIASGILGGTGQVLLTESYRHADMSVIAPFDYSSMIFAIAVGYLVFAEIPTLNMLVGGVIVVAAGVFIIWREHHLRLPRTPVGKGSIP
jgi:drug/metabolite transporter (DMT)-like permease